MQITQLTVTTVLGWIRDAGTIFVLVGLIWTARGFFEETKAFIKDIRSFMTTMTDFAHTVQNNHLKHIEEGIATIKRLLREELNDEDTNDYTAGLSETE